MDTVVGILPVFSCRGVKRDETELRQEAFHLRNISAGSGSASRPKPKRHKLTAKPLESGCIKIYESPAQIEMSRIILVKEMGKKN